MPNSIDSTGLTRVRYQDLRAEKETEFKNTFGQDIKTDVQSGFGQLISVSTQAEDELVGLVQVLLTAFDPNTANDVLLSRLAVIMNKRRNEAQKSTVTIDITTDSNGATIPVGFVVENSSGIQFQTTTILVIAPSSTASMEFEAVDDGPIAASAGALTIIKTPVFGVASVTNPADAIVGRNQETDAELRARLLKTSSNANSTKPGIFTALSEVNGVTYVDVIVNDTNVDFANGQKAHTVFPIVEGGADSDIAQALITKGVAGGIDYVKQGDISGVTIASDTYTDPISGQTYTAHWARPVNKQVYAAITVQKLSNYPADGAARIKTAVNEWVAANAKVGDTFYSSFLYCPINDVPGLVIQSVFVGTSANPTTTSVTMTVSERASIAEADIIVTEV
jgi:uncharacterized phage protein gp47/JayE